MIASKFYYPMYTNRPLARVAVIDVQMVIKRWPDNVHPSKAVCVRLHQVLAQGIVRQWASPSGR